MRYVYRNRARGRRVVHTDFKTLHVCVCIGQYYYYDDYYFKRERPCMHISHMRKIIFDVQALGGGGVGDGVSPCM